MSAPAAVAAQLAVVLVGLAAVFQEVGSAVTTVPAVVVVPAALVAVSASRVPAVAVVPAESAKLLVALVALAAPEVEIALVAVALVGAFVLLLLEGAVAIAGLRPCRPPADYRLDVAVQSLQRRAR